MFVKKWLQCLRLGVTDALVVLLLALLPRLDRLELREGVINAPQFGGKLGQPGLSWLRLLKRTKYSLRTVRTLVAEYHEPYACADLLSALPNLQEVIWVGDHTPFRTAHLEPRSLPLIGLAMGSCQQYKSAIQLFYACDKIESIQICYYDSMVFSQAPATCSVSLKMLQVTFLRAPKNALRLGPLIKLEALTIDFEYPAANRDGTDPLDETRTFLWTLKPSVDGAYLPV